MLTHGGLAFIMAVTLRPLVRDTEVPVEKAGDGLIGKLWIELLEREWVAEDFLYSWLDGKQRT